MFQAIDADDTTEELMGMDVLTNLWGIILWFFWIYVFHLK